MSYQRLAKYVVALEAETAKYQAGLEKARKQLGRFEKRQKADIQRMAKQFATLGVAAAAAFTAATKAVVGLADEIGKSAKVVGVSASALQELRFAAAQTGIEARGLDDSLRRLGRRVGEFANSGAGPAQKALEALNVEIRDAAGNVRPTEQVFDDVVRALQGVQSQSERSAYAAQLFGDDFGPKLVPLLDQGVEGINRLRQQARDLGLVIDDSLIQRSEELADKMNILTTALKVRVSEVILENADSIEYLTDKLISFVAAIGDAIQGWRNWLSVQDYNRMQELTGQRMELEGRLDGARGRNREGIQRAIDRIIQEQIELQESAKALEIALNRSTVYGSMGGGSAGSAASNGGSAGGSPAPFTGPMFPGSAVPERYDDGDWLNSVFSFEKLEAARDKMMEVTDEMTVYADQAARNMQTAFADFLFDPFEDGLKGMLRGFIDTLRRMAAEMAAAAIFGKFGGEEGIGAFFSGLFGGARAMGGPVSGGSAYLVGERGPELFVPGSSGSIVPNHAMGGVTVNIDARGSDNPERLLQLLPVIKNSIKSEIYSERRRGISG